MYLFFTANSARIPLHTLQQASLRPFRRLTAPFAAHPPAFALFLIIQITLRPRARTKLLLFTIA